MFNIICLLAVHLYLMLPLTITTIISDTIEESGSTKEVIIAGDFNSRTGKQKDSQTIGHFGEDVIKMCIRDR